MLLTLPPLHDRQYDGFVKAFEDRPELRFLVAACGTKFGKCLHTKELIPTPNGWREMGDLQVGDYVFDDLGEPTRIEYATDPMYDHKCYDVCFSDGSVIVADEEHLWETKTLYERVKRLPGSLRKTSDILETLTAKGRPNHSVDVTEPVQYTEKDLSIDPYVLGAWLGDGTGCTGVITTDDPEVLREIEQAGFANWKQPSQVREWRVEGLTAALQNLGVLNNKHVPEEYLRASVKQRLALLQGLMDTDGTISKRGHCSFDNMNCALVDSVQELLHSLGIKTTRASKTASINGKVTGTCYRVFFTTDAPVFRLPRKLARIRKVSPRMQRRIIVDVRERPSVPVRCIRVASPRHMFLAGRSFIPTHNTYGSTIVLVQRAWSLPNSLNWWISPTYAQSKMAYSMVTRLLPKGTFTEYKADLKLVLLKPDGTEHSTIEFKSGDNPDSLRGFGVHFFIMDEAARQPYESFVSVVTTVTQTMGKGFFISTPKGRGWFYDVYQRGEKYFEDGTPKFGPAEVDPFPEWYSIRMPTWTNPHVKMKAVEQMKANLPEDEFEQEVAARFLLESAGVFKGIRDCIKGTLQPPLEGHNYVMGVDLARLHDYSVLTVMDRSQRHVVAFERFNQISWEVQYHRIIQMARKYRALAVMDSTGLGDPIVEQIQRSGIRVSPYKIGGSSAKQQLIDKLRVNIEHQKISFPNIPILRQELEAYEYNYTEGGTIRFSAPSGKHDDAVISLALANWGADQDPFVYRWQNLRGV